MSHYSDDLYHKTSLRLNQLIPNFIENDFSLFVKFLKTYYEFLEQYDENPSAPTYAIQPGVVTVLSNESTITGVDTTFLTLSQYQKIRIGNEQYSIRNIISNTQLVIFEIPIRTQYGVKFLAETNKSLRQASGALRQILTIHDVSKTLPDFIPFFRDTFLRDLPQGLTDTKYLIPRILDFYRSRGSEDSYRFLFRILFGEDDLKFHYPYELTFKTSDGIYNIPQILRVRRESIQYASDIQRLTSNVYALEGREIVGLTSNTRARIAQVREEFAGTYDIITLLVEDITTSTETFELVLNTSETTEYPQRLLFSTYGTPPTENFREVYNYTVALEEQKSKNFIIDETIKTLPLLDPLGITASITGSVIGFSVVNGGRDFLIGDLIFVPPNFNGGYGAVGRVLALSNTVVEDVDIVNPGFGYYVGLPLLVDNDGTGGGGLSGRVSQITNAISTYGRPVLISDAVVSTILAEDPDFNLDSAPLALDDPDAVNPDETYRILQDPILINYSDWALGNTSSGLYLANLNSTISTVLDFETTMPFYINGQQIPIGEISEIEILSPGIDYYLNLPIVEVQEPTRPVTSRREPISTTLIPFIEAEIEPKVTPQIASVEVLSGGAGYGSLSWGLLSPIETFQIVTLQTETDENGLIYNLIQEPDINEDKTFYINSITRLTTTTSELGTNAVISIVTGSIASGQPRFKDNRGRTSDIYRIQDDRIYQPFSYVLTTEQPYNSYKTTIKRFVHPAGRLMLAEQTITGNINVNVDILTANVQTNVREFFRLTNSSTLTFNVSNVILSFGNMNLAVTTATTEINAPETTIFVYDSEPCELLRVIVQQDFELGMSLETYGYTTTGVVTNVNGAGKLGGWGAQTGGNTYNQYYSGFTIPSDTFCPDGAITIWSDTSAADEYTTGAPLIEIRDDAAFLSVIAGLGDDNASLQLNARLDGVVETNVNSISHVVTRGTYQKFQVCWSMATFNESNVLNSDGWIRVYVDNLLVMRLEDVPFRSNSGTWPTVYVGPMGSVDDVYFGETAHPCDATRTLTTSLVTITPISPSQVAAQQFIDVTATVINVYRILPPDLALPGPVALDSDTANVVIINDMVIPRQGMPTDTANVVIINDMVIPRQGMPTDTANVVISNFNSTTAITVPDVTITVTASLYDVTVT